MGMAFVWLVYVEARTCTEERKINFWMFLRVDFIHVNVIRDI